MPLYLIIFLTVTVIISTIFTIVSFKKTLNNLYLKTISSLCFTILGLLSLNYILTEYTSKISAIITILPKVFSYAILFELALILCLAGDMILGLPALTELKKDNLPVLVGGASLFLSGHIVYIFALSLTLGFSPYCLLIAIPFALFYTYANKLFGKLNYKKLDWGVLLYAFIESLSLSICIFNLFANSLTTFGVMILCGFVLFYASDMVLMHNYFGKHRRIISVLCHSFYYSAQIIIALSIAFIC